MKNLTIPAGFITSSAGDAIKRLLRTKDDVILALDWVDTLPRLEKVQFGLVLDQDLITAHNCDAVYSWSHETQLNHLRNCEACAICSLFFL